jgi:hypothetical protein
VSARLRHQWIERVNVAEVRVRVRVRPRQQLEFRVVDDDPEQRDGTPHVDGDNAFAHGL